MERQNQKQMAIDDTTLLNALHLKYYFSGVFVHTWWMDRQVYKCVFDLWVYQEIIFDCKPDIIIETGTARGGSALFYANICDAIGAGFIFSIDVKRRKYPKHKRIHYITGSSVSKGVVADLKNWLIATPNANIMVILDSIHTAKHVRKELEIYSDFVTKGQYLIVEDTNLTGHPIPSKGGPGPFEAVQEFIKKDRRYVIDRSREKFGLTFNPQGYLKRRAKNGK